MTLSAASIFEVRSTATAGNVNSGGFNPTNANGLANGAISGPSTASPVLSSASYNFVNAAVPTGDVGAWIYFPTQSNINSGWYQIASVSGGAATLSAAVGAAIQVTNNRFVTNAVAGCGTATSGVTFLVDYSQQDTAQQSYTDLASTNGTTNPSVVTSVAHPFTAQQVGNLIHVTAGTSWTAGWYEIVSVSAGAATLDRAVGAAATLSSGTAALGGAVSLGSAGATGIGDNSFFGAITTGQIAGGGRYFIKNGSYTLGQSSTTNSAGIFIEGYSSLRGDRPTGSSRPTVNIGANIFTLSVSYTGWCIFTGTASPAVSASSLQTRFFFCKFINTSATANRAALDSSGQMIGCEFVSYRGQGWTTTGSSSQPFLYGCYAHDCDIGVNVGAGASVRMVDSIVMGCVTEQVNITGTATAVNLVNNTIYGAENKLGIGVNIATGATSTALINNIIYGCATGVSNADTTDRNYDDYNDYFNNTADVNGTANWQKGANDLALDPQFTNVKQITGTTATTTAGNHLVQSGATFITSGVVAGRDYLYIKSGTGVTAGIYGILSVDSETQITTDITLTANATADKVWQITTGRDFSIGTNLKAGAYPGVFPGGLTTGYLDIGAVQRKEPTGGGSFTFGS